MKKRLGGLLAIALGAVLIGNGLTAGGSGTVGSAGGPAACGQQRVVGALVDPGVCPIGAIKVTDTTPAGAGVPATWDVTVTSTCLDPTTGNPVNVTISVPRGGNATTSSLFVFPTFGATANSPKCSYTLTRAVNPAFTVTFTPSSPVSLPFDETNTDPNSRIAQVAMLNSAVLPTTSVPATTSGAPSSSASAPASTSASSSASSAPDSGSIGTPVFVTESNSQSAAPIAETGPSSSIPITLGLGIGLVLLGLFLVFEGRIRRLAKHRG